MANLRYGDTGEDVKKIQEALGIKADGIWGKDTEAAVRNFQQQNNLAVDGIVGANTSAALFNNTSSSSVPANVTAGSSDRGKSVGYGPGYDIQLSGGVSPADYKANESYKSSYREPFTMSEETLGYKSQLEDIDAMRPADYESQYKGQIDEILQGIINKQPYDYKTDANYIDLYNRYKAIYEANGQKAMKDAMGSAAGLTGGYGSSYAQSVGQQAYNDYMNQLNDKSIDLITLARNMYDQDLAGRRQNLSDLVAMEDQDYARYNDEYSKWLNERNFAADMYNQSLGNDYNAYQYGTNFDYEASVDSKSDYDSVFDRAYALAQAGIPVSERNASVLNDDDVALLNRLASEAVAGTVTGSSGGGGGRGNGGGNDGTANGKVIRLSNNGRYTEDSTGQKKFSSLKSNLEHSGASYDTEDPNLWSRNAEDYEVVDMYLGENDLNSAIDALKSMNKNAAYYYIVSRGL